MLHGNGYTRVCQCLAILGFHKLWGVPICMDSLVGVRAQEILGTFVLDTHTNAFPSPDLSVFYISDLSNVLIMFPSINGGVTHIRPCHCSYVSIAEWLCQASSHSSDHNF